MTEPTLVVLAAGTGSRYGGQKQLEPVGPRGELILHYSIYDALRAGFGQVVFVISEAIENDFRATIGATIDRQCATKYVIQRLGDLPDGVEIPASRTKPWGTGQAALLCKDLVAGAVSVINADDFYGPTSFQILHDYLVTARDDGGVYDYCMVGFVLENTLSDHGPVARGVCSTDEDGYLVEIDERTHLEKLGGVARYTTDGGETWFELPLDSSVSMNMWGFTPSIFDELEAAFRRFLREAGNLEGDEFFLPVVVNGLLQARKARVRVLPTQEQWVGMTYRADRLVVEQRIGELISRGVYPKRLWD
jgi:hypothetical protein